MAKWLPETTNEWKALDELCCTIWYSQWSSALICAGRPQAAKAHKKTSNDALWVKKKAAFAALRKRRKTRMARRTESAAWALCTTLLDTPGAKATGGKAEGGPGKGGEQPSPARRPTTGLTHRQAQTHG